MTTERCERCDRPVATAADWAAMREHECDDQPCTWGDDRCWGDRAECEMVGSAIDWRTRARDEAKRAEAAEARPTWRDGVTDSIKVAEGRLATARALNYKPEYIVAIDEVLVFLRAMLERGGPSRSTVLMGKVAP
jgi:hypothetical protein